MARKPPPTDLIIGRGLLTAQAIAAELRNRMVARLARQRRRISDQALVELARTILADFEPILATNLAYSTLAAWVAGVQDVAAKIPRFVDKRIVAGRGDSGPPKWVPRPPMPPGRGSGPPAGPGGLFGDLPPASPVRFPLIERAAEYLSHRGLVSRRQFEAMGAQGRHDSFSVAYHDSIETLERIRTALRETVEQGASLPEFRKRLGEAMDASPVGPAHVETVYRTNIQSSFHDGHETLAQDPIVSEIFPYQEYLAIHDGRVREQHLAMEKLGLDGTNVYRRDDPVWDRWTPPNGYNCLLPNTSIEGRIELATRARYAGEAVEIVTRTCNRLCVTVNHPVLTESGFVAAGLIRKGDDVICQEVNYDRRHGSYHAVPGARVRHASNHARRFSPDVDIKYAPTTAAQVFASLALRGSLCCLPVGSDDFHGEAERFDGNVEIVAADSRLLLALQSSSNKFIEQFSLEFANSPSVVRSRRGGGSGFGGIGSAAATHGVPRGTALLDDRGPVCFDRSPFYYLSIGPASHLDASCDELPRECGPAATGLASQLLERNPGLVFLDEIVDVRRFYYSGHVHDFQCDGGWLSASGIIVSNCRCGINLLTVRAAAVRGVREAKEWLRTSRPPERPEWRDAFVPVNDEPGFGARARPRVSA